MGLRVLADRVRERTLTEGTGALVLIGAVTGHQRFRDALTVGDQTYYTIENGVEWEVGIGTYAGVDTLTRDTVFDSSSGGALIPWGPGAKDVFITIPADRVALVLRTNQDLIGSIDGANTVFTTVEPFCHDSLRGEMLYFNGQRLKEGVGCDYTVAESVPGSGYDTITLAFAPLPGENLLIDYFIAL